MKQNQDLIRSITSSELNNTQTVMIENIRKSNLIQMTAYH